MDTLNALNVKCDEYINGQAHICKCQLLRATIFLLWHFIWFIWFKTPEQNCHNLKWIWIFELPSCIAQILSCFLATLSLSGNPGIGLVKYFYRLAWGCLVFQIPFNWNWFGNIFVHTNSHLIGKRLLQTTSNTPLFFKSILTMTSTLGGGGGDNDDSDGDNNDIDADLDLQVEVGLIMRMNWMVN